MADLRTAGKSHRQRKRGYAQDPVVAAADAPIKVMGRYALFREIAAGGMAVVHLGKLQGPVGFSRTVAIKRLYPQYTRDPEFVSMLLDEARLAARIRHPNVVPTLDVVASSGELFLVMEYVHGDSLARLLRAATARKERVPLPVILSIVCGALGGLHAAHEARGARGEPLGIVHRDISPQNILVGSDGVPRIVDFGVAKAAGRVQTTRDGQLKGKMGYFAPEQISGTVTRKTDLFAMSIVLWEALAGRRLFRGENDATTLFNLLHAAVPPPSTFAPEVPPALDAAILKGLERDPSKRFETAREMAIALEQSGRLAGTNETGAWVERLAVETLAKRSRFLAEVEGSGGDAPSDDTVAAIMASDEAPDDETRSDSDSSARLPAAALAPLPGTPTAFQPIDHPVDDFDAEHHDPLERPSRPPPAESTGLSVSRSMGHQSLSPAKRPKRWAIGVAVALLGGVVGLVTMVLRHPENSAAKGVPAAPVASSAAPATPAGDVPPPAIVDVDTPEASATPVEKPAAPPGATVQRAIAPPAPRPAVAPARKADAKAPVVKPTPPPSHCATPYTLDASGRKKWKAECL